MKHFQKYFLLFLIFFSLLQRGNCQSYYQLKSSREFILSGTSVSVSLTGFLLSEYKHRLNADEILKLKKEDINAFDRSAVTHFSTSAGRTSDVLMLSSLALPFVLLFDKNIRDNSWQTGVMYFETLAIASVGINISKGLVSRARPYVYNPSVPEDLKQKRDATNSFFSGHTTLSAAATFFAAKVFCDYNPDSKWKPVVWIGATAIPLVTGYCRYRAGKHFLTDVITGFCYGALSGILIPQIHSGKKFD